MWMDSILTMPSVFALPFLLLHKLNLRPKVRVGVYAVFLLGFVDIAFSLTRFLTIQLTKVGEFSSITTIGNPPPQFQMDVFLTCFSALE
jgi:hypothetical protein